MKREIAMIAFVLLGMGMTASAQFGKKINLGKALQAGKDVVSAAGYLQRNRRCEMRAD